MKLACLFLLLLLPLSALAAPSQTAQFTLDNGLTLLVRENHQAPVVTVMVWYKVGSVDEPAGMTGISHVLEHMMFKGTKQLKPGEFTSIVSRFGGAQNAFTSADYTAYYQRYAADRLPLALELEAERMHNLVIDPQEFKSELKVVQEERRMRVVDQPNGWAWERFSAILRPGTGYAHPTIGWLSDLKQITPEKLRRWYQRYYQPGNAYLVVVGDVDIESTHQLVKRYFGDIPGRGEPPHAQGAMQPPAGERQLSLHLPVKVPVIHIGWNVPTLKNVDNKRDFYALSMLAAILDGGMSARLPSSLVRDQQIAAAAGGSYSGSGRGGGTFTLYATPSPGVTLEQLQQALLEQIRLLKKTPPSEQEMARIRAQVLAARVYKKDSDYGQAMTLGRLLVVGLPWQLSERFAQELARVTPEDVSRVARRYLKDKRRVIAYVLPAQQEEK